ncbi:hypothetical protein [Falsiroseomonas sp. HW251]|uniref:hypothetical protein n=1 Tax=Falsiroseomonas sp. HW251 TaxID=3390998 RepID=UPI003D31BFF5
MLVLPPDAGRALAEAVEKILGAAERMLGMVSQLQSPGASSTAIQYCHELFEVARGLMGALQNDPRELAAGFRRVLEITDALARLAEAEPSPDLRSAFLDQVRVLIEASRAYAPAIRTAAEREKAPWVRLLPQ